MPEQGENMRTVEAVSGGVQWNVMHRREVLLEAISRVRNEQYGSMPWDPLGEVGRLARDAPRHGSTAAARYEYAARVAAACLVLMERDGGPDGSGPSR